MWKRKMSIGLVGAALGLGFIFGACSEPTGSSPQDTTTIKALPLGDKNQAQTNQQKADELCPLCGLFGEATPVK